jgi:hypothetical protein
MTFKNLYLSIGLLILTTQAALSSLVMVNSPIEIYLFHFSEGNIQVLQCEDYTVVETTDDCTRKAGGLKVEVDWEEFHVNLKMVAVNPMGFPSQFQDDLALYGKSAIYKGLLVEKKKLEVEIQKINKYIKQYGKDSLSSRKLNSLKDQLSDNSKQLTNYKNIKIVSDSIDQTIQSLYDKIVSTDHYEFLKRINNDHLDFNILQVYINRPSLLGFVKFIHIPRGNFNMGSPSNENLRDDDEGLHKVSLKEDFHMMESEVSQKMWFDIMKTNPSFHKTKTHCPQTYEEVNGIALCPNHPVESITITEIEDFLNELNTPSSPFTLRLPTEAEWEYAVRAGTSTPFFWGTDFSKMKKYSCNKSGSCLDTSKIKSLAPNQYGLYDMTGNIWEFVSDKYSKTYDLKNPNNTHVLKGGTNKSDEKHFRSAYRGTLDYGSKNKTTGFRLVY